MLTRDVIIACDFASAEATFAFLDKFEQEPRKPFLKIGMELYYAEGPSIVREIKRRGHRIFLDLKLHDIPNTVASAVEPLSELGLWALTIHTSGGYEMMARSVAMRDKTGSRMKLLGITVLTSLGGALWSDVHPGCDMQQALVGRAETAQRAGLDGIVCSPLDLELLKGRAEKLLRVVPGIRAKKVSTEDQTRVATAKDAAEAGASYIVVGRPILEAADPIAAAKDILKTLGEVSH